MNLTVLDIWRLVTCARIDAETFFYTCVKIGLLRNESCCTCDNYDGGLCRASGLWADNTRYYIRTSPHKAVFCDRYEKREIAVPVDGGEDGS